MEGKYRSTKNGKHILKEKRGGNYWTKRRLKGQKQIFPVVAQVVNMRVCLQVAKKKRHKQILNKNAKV
jgi:hypothetical protein